MIRKVKNVKNIYYSEQSLLVKNKKLKSFKIPIIYIFYCPVLDSEAGCLFDAHKLQ